MKDDGIPFLDTIGHLESVLRHTRAVTQLEALTLVKDRGLNDTPEREFLERLLSFYEVPWSELEAYTQLYWLHHSTIRAKESLQFEPVGIDRDVNRALADLVP